MFIPRLWQVWSFPAQNRFGIRLKRPSQPPAGDGITVVVKEKHTYRQKARGFLAYASEKHSTISQSIRSLLSPGDDGFVLFGELKTVLSKKSMNPPYPGTRSFKWTEHSKKEIDNHENSRCCMF